jgi:beta-glucosidase
MIPYTLQNEQHGFVGISLYTFGIVPLKNTEKDKVACQRIRDFYFGW